MRSWLPWRIAYSVAKPGAAREPALTFSTCDTLTKILVSGAISIWRFFVTRRSVFVSVATFALLGLGSLALLAAPADQKSSAKTTATSSKSTASNAAAEEITVDGVKDIDPTKALGSKNAPVVMEVFTDFQCPACKQLYTTTLQRVVDNYVDSNKIYMVHRDFPLQMHAYSMPAALYARAACHIGKCQQVENVLFQNQEKWEMSGDVKGTVASVLTPAEMKKVEALVASGSLQPLIEKDKQIGQAIPVTQTPTSLLHAKDGQTYPIVGLVSYDVLKTLLDQVAK
jgi:protein-disulfide isomerase